MMAVRTTSDSLIRGQKVIIARAESRRKFLRELPLWSSTCQTSSRFYHFNRREQRKMGAKQSKKSNRTLDASSGNVDYGRVADDDSEDEESKEIVKSNSYDVEAGGIGGRNQSSVSTTSTTRSFKVVVDPMPSIPRKHVKSSELVAVGDEDERNASGNDAMIMALERMENEWVDHCGTSVSSVLTSLESESGEKIELDEEELANLQMFVTLDEPLDDSKIRFNGPLAGIEFPKNDHKEFEKVIKSLRMPKERVILEMKAEGKDTRILEEPPLETAKEGDGEKMLEDECIGYGDMMKDFWGDGKDDKLQDFNGEHEIVPSPRYPTMDDYYGDYNTGQIHTGEYEIDRRTEMSDGTVKLEFQGPSDNRVEDFWTEIADSGVKLIVMFGKFIEKGGLVNCGRYIPSDMNAERMCGDVIVARLTHPKTLYGHCRIQELAVRHKDVSEDKGWYSVWHCEREYQWDKSKDYGKENDEFEKLKLELLSGACSNVYAVHGPMKTSALLTPPIDDNEDLRFRRKLTSVRELAEKVYSHQKVF